VHVLVHVPEQNAVNECEPGAALLAPSRGGWL